MKKFVFLLSLTLAVGCDSDDDALLLPTPVAPVPAPGELPTSVSVVIFALPDEVCPDVSPLDRNGVLTHAWTGITFYEVLENSIVIQGNLTSSWVNITCNSTTTVTNARQEYKRGPAATNVIVTPTPDYFES